MNPKKTNFIIGISILLFLLIPVIAYSQDMRRLIVFASPTCHKCQRVKDELMPEIENRFKGKIQIEYRDITHIEDYTFLLSLKEKQKTEIEFVLPIFYLEGDFLNGKGEIKNNLIQLIANTLKVSYQEEKMPAIDLIKRFKSFEPFAIIGAGLADGINPCAFTVIVFFISFLTLQGYSRRQLYFIGLSFIFAVFITYLLVGLGTFNFLYRLKGFWIVTKTVNISVGLFSIILGIASIYDFFKFKKTHKTEDIMLQLPKAIKNRIHSVIGFYYRKSKDLQTGLVRPSIFKLILSALITGFLVSLLEAVCTGQLYLPTITFVLRTTHLKFQASLYLLLYNLMFIVPLLIIFLFALLGVTSEQFSHFLKKHLLGIKILMVALFFGLGIFLIWKA